MKALVLGAGVDAALEMPLTCELLPRLTEFLNTEQGIALDLALRSRLPRLNFNFDNFIKKTIDGFADEFSREMVVKLFSE